MKLLNKNELIKLARQNKVKKNQVNNLTAYAKTLDAWLLLAKNARKELYRE